MAKLTESCVNPSSLFEVLIHLNLSCLIALTMTKQMTHLNDCLQNWLGGQNFSEWLLAWRLFSVAKVDLCQLKKYKQPSSAAWKFLQGLISEFLTKKSKLAL